MANPTLVIITDRNDLDDQLFSTFAMCRDLIRQAPVQAENRDHLRQLLAVPSGGVIFYDVAEIRPGRRRRKHIRSCRIGATSW